MARFKFRLKDSVLRRLMVLGILGVAVSLALNGFSLAQINTMRQATPTIRDIQSEVTLDSRAEFYALNYFQLWLTGTPRDKDALASFYSAIPLNDLNPDPVGAESLNIAEKTLSLTDTGNRMWTFVVGATVYSPGISVPSRMFYEVSLVQEGESFSVVKLPEVVNFDRPAIAAGSAYTAVPKSSPLHQLSVNFSIAFLTQNNSGTLGRYVTANFKDDPLKNSPYTAADVVGAYIEGKTGADAVAPGDPTEAMFRVRVSSTQSTYVTMDIAVTVIKLDNGQWLVDSLSDPIVGPVTKKRG